MAVTFCYNLVLYNRLNHPYSAAYTLREKEQLKMTDYTKVINKLIKEAKEEDYLLEIVNNGEESHFINSNWKKKEIISEIMATDMAKLTFVAPSRKNAKFTVLLVFGNNLEETIADHTFTLDAEKICNKVMNHFSGE